MGGTEGRPGRRRAQVAQPCGPLGQGGVSAENGERPFYAAFGGLLQALKEFGEAPGRNPRFAENIAGDAVRFRFHGAAVGTDHQGAADVFTLLASTPFAAETRESRDTSRKLEEVVRVFTGHLKKR